MSSVEWLVMTGQALTPSPPLTTGRVMPGGFQDWVRESTTSTGTGDLTLSGAVTGFRTFADAGFGASQPVAYSVFAVDGAGNPTGAYETGIAQYMTGAARLSGRTAVRASSNSNAVVNFAAGTKHVIIAPLADMTVRAGAINNCRLSLDTNWCPTADVASSSTLRLLPGPAGGQIGIPAVLDLFVVGNVGDGVSYTLPTATLVSSRTCGTTSGSIAVTHGSATAWPVGMLVTGTGIPTGTYVLASTTTTVTLTRPATATNASVTLSCYQSIFDIYAYPSGSRDATTGMPGVLIAASPWTNNSTPPAKDTYATGVPLCMGVSVLNARYLGTIQYITTTTSCDTAAARFLWNQYNQMPRRLYVADSGAAYNYTTAAWRTTRADYGFQVEWVAGAVADMLGHMVELFQRITIANSSGNTMYGGIAIDTDTSPTAPAIVGVGNGTAYGLTPGMCHYRNQPGIGYHRAMMVEYGGAGATQWPVSQGGNVIQGSILG